MFHMWREDNSAASDYFSFSIWEQFGLKFIYGECIHSIITPSPDHRHRGAAAVGLLLAGSLSLEHPLQARRTSRRVGRCC